MGGSSDDTFSYEFVTFQACACKFKWQPKGDGDTISLLSMPFRFTQITNGLIL